MALINLLNLNKANGHDDIDTYFLKIASSIIAFPLSLFFNHSTSLGIFPNKLKLAKVIPVYIKGSPDRLNNYRPISLLPSSSKLLYVYCLCERMEVSRIRKNFCFINLRSLVNGDTL